MEQPLYKKPIPAIAIAIGGWRSGPQGERQRGSRTRRASSRDQPLGRTDRRVPQRFRRRLMSRDGSPSSWGADSGAPRRVA